MTHITGITLSIGALMAAAISTAQAQDKARRTGAILACVHD
jgi:hypothetical protein